MKTGPLINFAIHALVFAAAVSAGEPDQAQQEEKEAAPRTRPSDYAFKPIRIEPSLEDGFYTGHFRFINRQSKPVRISGFEKPDHERFAPRFVGFEAIVDGEWKKVPVGYCGTGAQAFAMKSQVPYEFICGLWRFEEQEAPLTARIRIDDDFVSEPFVLDWKNDRANGAFAAARKRNFQKVRAALAKAGFKPELIQGDDFCERLIRSLVTSNEPKRKDGFAAFNGKLAVTPVIELNGIIWMEFDSEDAESREIYRGWLRINPNKFSPAWFRNSGRKHLKTSIWGHGLEMEIDDGSAIYDTNVRLGLHINYLPNQTVKPLTEAEAKQMSMKMFDKLGSRLSDGR